jgi:P27 family predicted phage terminase small subunit
MAQIPVLPCPAHLSEAARPIWCVTIAALADARHLGAEVLIMVERYCTLYCRWREAEQHLTADGIIVAAPRSGVPSQSPWLAVSRQAHAAMMKLEVELQLSPLRRATSRPLLADGSPAPPSVWDDLIQDDAAYRLTE